MASTAYYNSDCVYVTGGYADAGVVRRSTPVAPVAVSDFVVLRPASRCCASSQACSRSPVACFVYRLVCVASGNGHRCRNDCVRLSRDGGYRGVRHGRARERSTDLPVLRAAAVPGNSHTPSMRHKLPGWRAWRGGLMNYVLCVVVYVYGLMKYVLLYMCTRCRAG